MIPDPKNTDPKAKLSRDNITFCIPAYNEEESIGPTLQELKEAFPTSEIIVVNDGSEDETERVARAVPGISVVSHERNRGYGAALKTAMRLAQNPVVVWYDADHQHRPADVYKIAAPVIEGKKDALIGCRSSRSASSVDRIIGKKFLKIVAEIIARQEIPDLNSGLRCFKLDVIKKYLHLLPDGFSASSTSTLLMIKRGYRLGFTEITAVKRKGRSKIKIFRDGWITLQLLIRMLVLFEAFGLFTVLSLLQVFPAVIYGTVIAFVVKKGFPVLASTVIISGILTFLIGILCDQITALRKERFEE